MTTSGARSLDETQTGIGGNSSTFAPSLLIAASTQVTAQAELRSVRDFTRKEWPFGQFG